MSKFRITEKVVLVRFDDGRHMIILRAKKKGTKGTIWAIGDDRVCAITREDCVRNPIDYNSVLIKEFPYNTNTPQTVGVWWPLIKELVAHMLLYYLEYNGLVHVYPQWLPDEFNSHMDKKLFDEFSKDCDHIILHEDEYMEFVPRRKKDKNLNT